MQVHLSVTIWQIVFHLRALKTVDRKEELVGPLIVLLTLTFYINIKFLFVLPNLLGFID